MTTRPRLSSRRHFAFISATVSRGLSSMRMSVRLRAEAASAIFTQSVSRRSPLMRRVFSTRASLDKRRVASCSLDISREKMATVCFVSLATLSATFSAMEVLPMPGRAASSTRSDLFSPEILASTAERPVERPAILVPSRSLISLRWSSTSGSTVEMGTMSWALRPRRMA